MLGLVRNARRWALEVRILVSRPVVLVADEIGSVVAQMDTKEAKAFISKLVAIIRGLEVLVFIVCS